MLTGLTGDPIHVGNWGTWDVGLTEALAKIFGQGRTSQGGSNLRGDINETTLVPAPGGGYQQAAQPIQRTTPTKSSATTGGGSNDSRLQELAKANRNPTQEDEYQQLLREGQGASSQREQEARGAIESGYGGYLSGMQGLQSMYEAGRDEELGSASKTYESIFGGLDEQKQTNLSKVQAGKEAVGTRKAQSIKDLQQNLSNTLRGATMQFGAMGAGDTSATRTMLPYAYTKLAGAQEGSINKQANDQMFQLDQDERDTELEFTKMWKDTEVQKEQSLQGIRNYYGDAIRNVQSAIAQAPLDKARDLSALSQSLLQEAQTNLRQLEAEDRQRKDSAKTWATNRMSELNNLKLQMANKADFSPQDIVWDELSAGGLGAGSQTSGQEFYNPMLIASKKRQEYLGA